MSKKKSFSLSDAVKLIAFAFASRELSPAYKLKLR